MPTNIQHPPPLPAAPPRRPRLDALLDEALRAPLVVVNAGAGFGKTTALSQYLAGADYRAVWFTFAAPDDIPARFWAHLTQAFAAHRPTLGEKMAALGFPETLQQFSLFLADLTEELYQDERTVAFLFDDIHLVAEPAVLGFVANLINARLENSSIVLLTRAWPLFDRTLALVPRMVRSADLRFTPGETLAYLRAEGLAVDEDIANRVNQYVSGWPVALSLVALAMAHGKGEGADGTTLAETKPGLYALFEQEIFSQYTPAERDLLVKLSALDSFPRGLVQAVTGERERDLSQLLNGNVFIHYDADAMRLSFHPLYREFLREKLLAIPPEELNAAYRRAGEWCRENGHLYDAVRYFERCGDHDLLWRALSSIEAVRHSKSEAEFIIEQIEALPGDFRRDHPMTRIVLAAMLINNLRFAEAAAALDEVGAQLEDGAEDAETLRLLGEYSIVRGFHALSLGQNGFEVHFRRAARLLPKGSGRWGGKLQIIDLGPGLNLQSAKAGELKKSLACFTEGVPHMARVLHGTGQGLDKLCECEALFLTGELKQAAEPAYQALYTAQAAAQYDIVGNALFMLLRIHTAQGDYAQVLDTLEHVGRYEADRESQSLGIWDIIRAWFYAEVDQVENVPLWIRNPVQKGFAPLSLDRPMLVRLRCLVAAGQYAEALALALQLEALASGKSAVLTLLYTQLVRAVTHNALGHPGEATAALKAAYALAKGNRLFMPFVEYGGRTRSLLERVRQTPGHGIPQPWLDETYAKASTYAKHHAYLMSRYRQEQEGHLRDYGLSPRETELLTNLSQGFTREELADVMDLSINTVKSMTKQVFAKLGAINAADAVRIAIINQLI